MNADLKRRLDHARTLLDELERAGIDVRAMLDAIESAQQQGDSRRATAGEADPKSLVQQLGTAFFNMGHGLLELSRLLPGKVVKK
jgi:hypothetical protein